MKVVNLFAGPGAGKSTAGCLLTGMLSMAGYQAEYLPEFSKFMTFANNQAALRDQLYMFGKQHNRLEVLRTARLDFVVVDGPLLLSALYTPRGYLRSFLPLIVEATQRFDNLNFLLLRNPRFTYSTVGRSQTESEAQVLCRRTAALLRRYAIPHERLPVTDALAGQLFTRLTGQAPPLVVAPHREHAPASKSRRASR